MNKTTQEFFWTPQELLIWVCRVCGKFGLWLVVWRVGQTAEQIDPTSVQPSIFEDVREDSIQFFLGATSICAFPQWRVVGDRRELDFVRSYSVQLVPSILSTDGPMLLLGQLATMRVADYDNKKRATELKTLFNRLVAELKHGSDASGVVVQSLVGGDGKRRKSILVSPAVSGSNLKLKQFSRGEVEFRVEST